MATELYEAKTALDVKEGDIILAAGQYRCTATEVKFLTDPDDNHPFARYIMHSTPTPTFPRLLPRGYEGMTSGGNKKATVLILVRKENHAQDT